MDGLDIQPGNSKLIIQNNANENDFTVEMSGVVPSRAGVESSQDNLQDNWSSESYQRAASFVPQMTQKVVQLLDVQPDDVILDIGCGGMFSCFFSTSLEV